MVHKWHWTGRAEGGAASGQSPLRVLLLEPSPEDAERVGDALRAAGFEPEFGRRDSPRATSELHLRAAFEGGFDSFFVFDAVTNAGSLDFRLVDLNSRAAEILGAPKEELIGQFFDEFSPNPERTAFFVERFRQVYESGVPLEEEYEVQTDRVTPRWLYYQIVPISTGVAATVKDVTERKRGERALHESERRFMNVVQHVPGVFFTLVPHGGGEASDRLRFDFLSDGIHAITGHAAAEFAGDDRITFAELLHPDDRITLAGADDLLLSGRSFGVDVRVQHPDGGLRWVHLKAEPNFDEDGTVRSGSGLMLDVTERKRTEDALHLRQRAIEAMTQGLVIIDAAGEERSIVYVNPAFEELSGYARDELVGLPPAVFAGPETDVDTLAELRAAFDAHKSFSGDIFTYRKDGTGYWTSLRTSPVADEKGTVTHFISIHTDDTPRRKLQEQFLQAQKMEAVGRLAGGIAHDFNNVLLIIRGYSSVLMSMAGEAGDGWEEAKEIEIAATRASDLVRQLLSFTRTQVMQPTVLDVNNVVRETQKLLEPLLGEDIEVRLALDADAGAIEADAAHIEQALVNLAMNARDAMPDGGSIVVRTRNTVIEAGVVDDLAQLPRGAYTAISVEDNGAGMDTATRMQAFEPFFSTKGAAQGTGLGLSAVYGMVKQSGGDITITSAPGQGTSVTIYLPHAREAAAIAAPRAAPATAAAHDETVLLVEDDETARRLVGRVLRESGYSVHEAALPDEALRMCDEVQGRIDLLLSDVVMPQMSGPKLAKLVLQRRPDTRVMFVSGYIERPEDVDDVSTAADFLQKPFTPDQLVETVRRVLDGQRVSA